MNRSKKLLEGLNSIIKIKGGGVKRIKGGGLIVRSGRLEKQVSELVEDPIIKMMAKDIASDKKAKQEFLDGGHSVMSAANKHYHEMGGKKAISIGGPLEAIQYILKTIKSPDDIKAVTIDVPVVKKGKDASNKSAELYSDIKKLVKKSPISVELDRDSITMKKPDGSYFVLIVSDGVVMVNRSGERTTTFGDRLFKAIEKWIAGKRIPSTWG